MRMKFSGCVIAVRDVAASADFYVRLLDRRVEADFGWNVVLSGGLSIQQNFAWLVGLSDGDVQYRSNSMELYFEVDDLDAFCERLGAFGDAELLHPVRTHAWGQRVIRLYDPDGHIVEVGEDMREVARRLLQSGMSVEQVAEKTQHTIEFVKNAGEDVP